MGLFSLTQELSMDLGTANTIIMHNDKIVVNEPSIVALDNRTDKMVAVGNQAKMMYEKTNTAIRVIRPLRNGVIADFDACEQMMRGLISMVDTGRRLFSPSLKMVIGVPSGSTEVELRAVRDSAEHAGIIEYVNKFNEEHHLGDGEKIEFLQIKEKWGGLRIYTNYGTKELHEMIDKAEEESYNVCENCGLRTDVGLKIDGWHMTLCKYCATNLAMERKIGRAHV